MINEQLVIGRWSTCEEVAMLTDPVTKAIESVDQARCDDCPPERVCAWDCEQGQGVLEIMMGEALAAEARAASLTPIKTEPDVEPIERALYEIYT
jgi:hypothetical protein